MPLSSLLSSRSKADSVKQLKDSILFVENENEKDKKNHDEAVKTIHKSLLALKDGLLGNRESNFDSTLSETSQLCGNIYSQELITIMINNFTRVDFEDRKEIVAIFNNLLRRQVANRFPAVEHLSQRPTILFKLIDGYDDPDIALQCGMMLREAIRVEELTEIILKSSNFYKFFDFVQKSTFDIASDAFATFRNFLRFFFDETQQKDLIVKHKKVSADFLEENYETFFGKYRELVNSENYVTRRQSLKLLGEILHDRFNYSVMTKFISNPEYLKQLMNHLKEKSKNIQFEAFHVFKIFVANPSKPKPIVDILLRNQEKLIEFLSAFHADRTDDDQFNDEKAYLIKQISELKEIK